jgi:hypothetical protein
VKRDATERRRAAYKKMLEHMRQQEEKARKREARKAARELEAGEAQLIGPVRSQTGKRKTKHAGADRLNNFTLLPESIQDEANNLFVEGATFEDITEFINETHTPESRDGESDGPPAGITLSGVERYYRMNLELQTQRIKRLQERGQALKQALAGDPSSAEAELADAILLTGIMGLDRSGARFRVRDANQAFASRESMRLKQESFKVETLDAEARRRNIEARTATETRKLEQLGHKIQELERAMERESSSPQLGPETMQKIREIYGLVAEEPAGNP